MNVTLPDGTTVEGVPEGTSRADLADKLKKNGMKVPDSWLGAPKAAERAAKREAPKEDTFLGMSTKPTPVGEAMMATASGMLAKPISEVMGLGAAGAAALGFGGAQEPRLGATPKGFQEEMQRQLTYQPRTEAGRLLTEYNPMALIGKGIGWVGDKLGQVVAPPESAGPIRATIGSGVSEAVKQAPQFLGAKAVKPAEAAATAMSKRAMQSALKPTEKQMRTGKAEKAVETMLEGGYNVSRGGAERMESRIDTLNQGISRLIQNSPAIIDRNKVASYLTDAMRRFEKQVTPGADLKAITDAWTEFININPKDIPVQRAQELKSGTYGVLKDKAYGELKGAQVEAQKTLARGLKEEIAKAVPQVDKMNAEESRLLSALPMVERRLLHEANKNPVGLGILSIRPSHLAAWMADRSSLFKSIVANMINRGSKPVAQSLPVFGIAMSNPPQSVQPPPQ